MTVLPAAFTTVAPCGTCTLARGPAAVMRSPLTRIDRVVDGRRTGAVDQARADDRGDRSRGAALRAWRCGDRPDRTRAQRSELWFSSASEVEL